LIRKEWLVSLLVPAVVLGDEVKRHDMAAYAGHLVLDLLPGGGKGLHPLVDVTSSI